MVQVWKLSPPFFFCGRDDQTTSRRRLRRNLAICTYVSNLGLAVCVVLGANWDH